MAGVVAGCGRAEDDPFFSNPAVGADAGSVDGISQIPDSENDESNSCGRRYADCDKDQTNGCEIDLQSNPKSCGECGRGCGVDEVCSEGECCGACAKGLTNCFRACVNMASNRDHCGACGHLCSQSETCSEGSCIPSPSNPDPDPNPDPTPNPNPSGACDSALAPAGDAADFAKAIGICSGVVSAEYTNGFAGAGAPGSGQHGILSKFGNVVVPLEGARIGALSTGYAGEYNGSGVSTFRNSKNWSTSGNAPSGYPKGTAGCPVPTTVKDVVNLRVKLKAPANANAFQFSYNFLSSEWPDFLCSSYNDSFVAMLTAPSLNGGNPQNIALDASGQPMTANSSSIVQCTPGVKLSTGQVAVCSAGDAALMGTGFEGSDGAGTGWLTVTSPIAAGEEFELAFMIWDTGDGALDSLVLIDNFKWMTK